MIRISLKSPHPTAFQPPWYWSPASRRRGAAPSGTHSSRRLEQHVRRRQGVCHRLRDPELLIESIRRRWPIASFTGIDVANAANAWFRNSFAGKAETSTDTGRSAWLVRMIGQHVDPDRVAQIPVGTGRRQVPLASVANVSRARAKTGSLASYAGRPAVMFAVTKKSRTNTLELIERINAFIAGHNPILAAEESGCALLDDQTTQTREIDPHHGIQTPCWGWVSYWRAAGCFSARALRCWWRWAYRSRWPAPFAVLHATGHTLNISVLLGTVIALGMLVDDTVVVVEAIYFKMQRGITALDASLSALREVFSPVTSSVLTTMAAFPAADAVAGQSSASSCSLIPFVVTLALAISLVEAYWILPCTCGEQSPRLASFRATGAPDSTICCG